MPKRARNKRRFGWGGRRTGAGRPRRRARRHASEPHRQRPSLVVGHPIHVVARFVDGLRLDIGRRSDDGLQLDIGRRSDNVRFEIDAGRRRDIDADRRRDIASRPRPPTDIDSALAPALALAHERGDFQILDVRVARDAIHLVVEAADKLALARGMQGFQVSAARGINRATNRRGGVFADRYRARSRR